MMKQSFNKKTDNNADTWGNDNVPQHFAVKVIIACLCKKSLSLRTQIINYLLREAILSAKYLDWDFNGEKENAWK